MNKILRKIFRKGKQRGQVFLAGFGFLLGLVLLLTSSQMYLQITRLLSPDNQSNEYLILSKKVSFANAVTLRRADFSDSEIKDLEQQSFVDKVGVFSSNQFKVIARNQTLRMMTEMFFEALPSDYLDVDTQEFSWKEGDEVLPAVLSKDMLHLYNFGYALSNRLPQLPESAFGTIIFDIELRGKQGIHKMKARIVGFSERVPSIIVPKTFMDWANKNIGENKKTKSSRLIIKVKNPADPNLAEYLETHNLEVNQDRLNASKAGGIVQIIMSVISLVGLFFIGLSFIIFIMNFRLILAEAKDEIALLLQLGYTPKILGNYLIRTFLVFILFFGLLAKGLSFLTLYFLQDFLIQKGLEVSQGMDMWVIALGFIFILLSILINIWAVNRALKKYA